MWVHCEVTESSQNELSVSFIVSSQWVSCELKLFTRLPLTKRVGGNEVNEDQIKHTYNATSIKHFTACPTESKQQCWRNKITDSHRRLSSSLKRYVFFFTLQLFTVSRLARLPLLDTGFMRFRQHNSGNEATNCSINLRVLIPPPKDWIWTTPLLHTETKSR